MLLRLFSSQKLINVSMNHIDASQRILIFAFNVMLFREFGYCRCWYVDMNWYRLLPTSCWLHPPFPTPGALSTTKMHMKNPDNKFNLKIGTSRHYISWFLRPWLCVLCKYLKNNSLKKNWVNNCSPFIWSIFFHISFMRVENLH